MRNNKANLKESIEYSVNNMKSSKADNYELFSSRDGNISKYVNDKNFSEFKEWFYSYFVYEIQDIFPELELKPPTVPQLNLKEECRAFYVRNPKERQRKMINDKVYCDELHIIFRLNMYGAVEYDFKLYNRYKGNHKFAEDIFARKNYLGNISTNIDCFEHNLTPTFAHKFAELSQWIFGKDTEFDYDFFVRRGNVTESSVDYSVSTLKNHKQTADDYELFWWMENPDISRPDFQKYVMNDFTNEFIPYFLEMAPDFHVEKIDTHASEVIVILKPEDWRKEKITVNEYCFEIRFTFHLNRMKEIWIYAEFRKCYKNENKTVPLCVSICFNHSSLASYGFNDSLLSEFCSKYKHTLTPKYARLVSDYNNFVQRNVNKHVDYEYLLNPELDKKVEESINYSINNIESKASYNSPYSWRYFIGDDFSEEFFNQILDDVNENLLEDIRNIFTNFKNSDIDDLRSEDMGEQDYYWIFDNFDYSDKSYFWVKRFKNLCRISKIEVNCFNIEKKDKGDFQSGYQVSVTVYVSENSLVEEKDLLQIVYHSNSNEGMYLAQPNRYIEHNISDYNICVRLSKLCELFFGNDNKYTPEFFLMEEPKDMLKTESVDYSVSKMKGKLPVYQPNGFLNISGHISLEMFDYVVDDFKENIVPEIIAIFPEYDHVTYKYDRRFGTNEKMVFIEIEPEVKGGGYSWPIDIFGSTSVFNTIQITLVHTDHKELEVSLFLYFKEYDEDGNWFRNKAVHIFTRNSSHQTIDLLKHYISNMDICYKFVELVDLFYPDNQTVDAEYFYKKLPVKDKEELGESVDYSVEIAKSKRENLLMEPFSFFNIPENFKITTEDIVLIEDNIREHLIPELHDIWNQFDFDDRETYYGSNIDSKLFRFHNPGGEFCDFVYKSDYPGRTHIEMDFDELRCVFLLNKQSYMEYPEYELSCVMTIMMNNKTDKHTYKSYKVAFYENVNGEKSSDLTEVEHLIDDYDLCVKLSETVKLFWPEDTEHTPDYFYFKNRPDYREYDSVGESVDYSVSSLKSKREAMFNEPMSFLYIPKDFEITYEDLAQLGENMAENLIPELHDIWDEFVISDRPLYFGDWIDQKQINLENPKDYLPYQSSQPGVPDIVFNYDGIRNEITINKIPTKVKYRYVCVLPILMCNKLTNQLYKTSYEVEFFKNDNGEISENIHIIKNAIDNYEICVKISETAKLFWPEKTEYTPEYFYYEQPDYAKSVEESVDYSVNSLKTNRESMFNQPLSFMYLPKNSVTTEEEFDSIIENINENLVPVLQDIWDKFEISDDPIKHHYRVDFKFIDLNSPDGIVYRSHYPGRPELVYDFGFLRNAVFFDKNQQPAEYTYYCELRIDLYNNDIEAFVKEYSIFLFKNKNGEISENISNIKHLIADYDLCVKLSETAKLFWPDKTEYTPEYFYFYKDSKKDYKQIEESTDYSINKKNQAMIYRSPNEFYDFVGKKVTQEWFNGFKEDILENIVPEISEIVPEMDSGVLKDNSTTLEYCFVNPKKYIPYHTEDNEYVLNDIIVSATYYKERKDFTFDVFVNIDYYDITTGKIKYNITPTIIRTTPVIGIKTECGVLYKSFSDYKFCQLMSSLVNLFNPEIDITPDYFYKKDSSD